MRKIRTEEKRTEAIEIGARMKKVRRNAGMSLSDIADRLNRDFGASTNKGMLSKYENGVHAPSASMIYCLSIILGVPADYLLGKSDVDNNGSITQGTEGTGYILNVYTSLTDYNQGEKDLDSTEIIPTSWLKGGRTFFAYKISSGRFAPRYFANDIVIFEKKIKASKDQVALVSVGGAPAFLCLIDKKREGKYFIPLDPAYSSEFYSTQEIAETPVKIIGIAVQLRRPENC
ncbi:MAG: helix-turn-helix domain-containing protein [Oscillospiraceae bacterium]|nr:helix-turn-helix domain-containing protein [Oscillospiraceae bacterium]